MPMPNFFGNYFYGKSGKKDFTQADLPTNRLQLFRDVLRVRRGSLVGMNLLYLLFWLPALFWTFMNLLQLFSPPADAGDGYPGSLLLTYLAGMLPLIALTGPFNLGVSYVLRTWARDEHSFALADFAAAVKSNWKQGLILGAVNGALPLLIYICCRFYLGMAEASLAFYLPLAIVLIAALIWILSAPILPMMMVTYDLGFFAQAKNAVLMTLAEFPWAVLIRLTTLIVPMLLVALYFTPIFGLAMGASALLYALFLPAFHKFTDASFANYLCEKYLNPRIEGAHTGIGLRPKEET